MKRTLSIMLLGVVAAASALAQTPQPQTPQQETKPAQTTPAKPAEAMPTVDQILDKYVQAVGGKAAIQKLNSTFSKGTIDIPVAGVSGPIEIYAKAPNKSVAIIDIPGFGKVMEGYDGTVGWAQDPQTGLREKTGVELAAVKRGSDYYRDIKLKDLYTKMEVKGKQKVGDRETYVVEATPAEGAPDKYYFDTQTGLIVRMDQVLESPLGQIPFESILEDYRDVDGVKTPFVVRRNSSVINLTIKLDEVKHNVPVEDAKFAKPPAQ
jgi:zinc protease